MRVFTILGFLFLLFSCHKKKAEAPRLKVDYDVLERNSKNGLMTYNGVLFTGTTEQYLLDGTTLKMTCSYVDGLKDGKAKRWYSNRVLNYETFYVKGRKQGATKVWYKNGQLQRETTYFKGVVHGQETVWYPTGEKQKERKLYYGQENGMQKAWRKTGKLYANYQAVNGRIFGLKGSNMCYKVENEKVKK
ncbi:toxin-antitoxin system YwqK family antitoxin [Wenyingzhuangia aestuarii]|uniref:toxin-antitoxin system YwqK family antitoxin n=1 Tax=Wenyingzhuangia aestuarii TaxID=1647582 RepID=UPI00143CA7E7|nr:toxin-antitoxin system YwqK family antitoxin [Wenyingzhuangia aestuarii]NJB82571.1 antitoxin component YwqK of YwqJK toxin-antitoxin module [Wenyingzhuangia aestuarii]